MTGDAPRILGLSAAWARRLLIVSLVVNFLVLGAIVGLGLRVGDKMSKGVGRHVIGEITQIIGEDRRERAEAIIRDRKGNQRSFRGQRKEDWRELAAYVSRPDFNADGLRDLLHEHADRRDQLRRTGFDPLVEVIALMTPEERAAFGAKIIEFVDDRASREE